MAGRQVNNAAVVLCCLMAAPAAHAQTALDRADPTAHAPERVGDTAPPKQAPVPIDVQQAAPAVAAQSSVLVGAVSLAGLHVMSPADFADILGDYVGRLASPDDLATLAGRVATRAHDRGYLFASAGIEPQRLAAGVLIVTVDEGTIDAIRLDGPDQPAVRAALQPLVGRGPVTLAEVERRLLIAGDIDGVAIRSSRFVRERGQGVLVVRLTTDRISARAALRNDGSKPLGPEQVYLQVNANQLLFDDDSLTVSYQGTPAQPRELEYGRARYAKRVSAAGTEVAVSGSMSASDPGAYFAPYDITGRSWFAGVSVLQPLQRRRAASWWLSGEFDVRGTSQYSDGNRVRRDRVAVVRLALNGYREVLDGRLRLNVSMSQGLGILGATRAGDPFASRRDADGTFTTLEVWADWTKTLSGKLSLRLAADGQWADQPLLASEEAGLGGSAFVRGYDWSERSGDEGAMGLVELRYDIDNPFGLIRRAQVYAYVDGGTVSNLRGGYGGGSLASAGAGVRADVTRTLGATMEVAVPLTGARYDTGNSDPRVNLGVAKSF
jgi:hemolysin activation/secretion protein